MSRTLESWIELFREYARWVYETPIAVRSWRYLNRRGIAAPGTRYVLPYAVYGVETFILLDVGTLEAGVLLNVAKEVVAVMGKYSSTFTFVQFADTVKSVKTFYGRHPPLESLDIMRHPVDASSIDEALKIVEQRSCILVQGKGWDAVIIVTSGTVRVNPEARRLADERLPVHTKLRVILYTDELGSGAFKSWVKVRIDSRGRGVVAL